MGSGFRSVPWSRTRGPACMGTAQRCDPSLGQTQQGRAGHAGGSSGDLNESSPMLRWRQK